MAFTVAGIPFTWLGLAALQRLSGGSVGYGIETPIKKLLAVTWQAPWLLPYEREKHWMVPTASLVLLLPFFFASYVIEANVIGRLEPQHLEERLRRSVFRANFLSYLLLSVVNLGRLFWSLYHEPGYG